MSWVDNAPEWLRGTYALTEEELAAFDRRVTDRMIAAEEGAHQWFMEQFDE